MRVFSDLGLKHPQEKASPAVQGFRTWPKEQCPNNCPQYPPYFIGKWVRTRTTRYIILKAHRASSWEVNKSGLLVSLNQGHTNRQLMAI